MNSAPWQALEIQPKIVARFLTGSANITFRKSPTLGFSRRTSSSGSISNGSSNSRSDVAFASRNFPRFSRDSGVSGRSSRAISSTSAGSAPSARPMRHRTPWPMPVRYISVITTMATTSPRPNMNCQRDPIVSRAPFDIDSMM